MMSEFLGSFLTPSLPLVRILFTDPLLVKSEFHGPPPSPYIWTSFMDVPLPYYSVVVCKQTSSAVCIWLVTKLILSLFYVLNCVR